MKQHFVYTATYQPIPMGPYHRLPDLTLKYNFTRTDAIATDRVVEEAASEIDNARLATFFRVVQVKVVKVTEEEVMVVEGDD